METKKHSTSRGSIEETAIADITFEQEYQRYQRSGIALDSSSNQILGNGTSMLEDDRKVSRKKRKGHSSSMTELIVDEDDLDPQSGPWIKMKENSKPTMSQLSSIEPSSKQTAVEADLQIDLSSTIGKEKNVYVVEPDEEEEKWEKVNERKQGYLLPPRPARGSIPVEARSTFHGEALHDYQGRPWTSSPPGVRPSTGIDDHDCFIPKKCIKKFVGHTKGVQAIEFFPGTGHLLLSASLDGKCKIWDCTTDFGVKRTYEGHSEAIRSIHMNSEGKRFLSSGFDRYIRLWDTETGQAAGTFTNRKMAYQVKFAPLDNNIFLAACNDNKIYQWDCRTGEVCQQYNHHLQACNTITFFDGGKKFISTSDDKKILIWEYDIPVPIKYIAEPDMHSVPSVTIHPSEVFFAGQSMDNKIVVYSCGEKVKQMRKKVFQGHNNSGYACQVGFSPNGKFVVSGDGHGELHFWDWKSTKSYRKFHAHDSGPCMSAVWHPLNPSWVASCGWDGLIKLWD